MISIEAGAKYLGAIDCQAGAHCTLSGYAYGAQANNISCDGDCDFVFDEDGQAIKYTYSCPGNDCSCTAVGSNECNAAP